MTRRDEARKYGINGIANYVEISPLLAPPKPSSIYKLHPLSERIISSILKEYTDQGKQLKWECIDIYGFYKKDSTDDDNTNEGNNRFRRFNTEELKPPAIHYSSPKLTERRQFKNYPKENDQYSKQQFKKCQENRSKPPIKPKNLRITSKMMSEKNTIEYENLKSQIYTEAYKFNEDSEINNNSNADPTDTNSYQSNKAIGVLDQKSSLNVEAKNQDFIKAFKENFENLREGGEGYKNFNDQTNYFKNDYNAIKLFPNKNVSSSQVTIGDMVKDTPLAFVYPDFYKTNATFNNFKGLLIKDVEANRKVKPSAKYHTNNIPNIYINQENINPNFYEYQEKMDLSFDESYSQSALKNSTLDSTNFFTNRVQPKPNQITNDTLKSKTKIPLKRFKSLTLEDEDVHKKQKIEERGDGKVTILSNIKIKNQRQGNDMTNKNGDEIEEADPVLSNDFVELLFGSTQNFQKINQSK